VNVLRLLGGGIVASAVVLLVWAAPWEEGTGAWPGIAGLAVFTGDRIEFTGVEWRPNEGYSFASASLLGTVPRGNGAEPPRIASAFGWWRDDRSGVRDLGTDTLESRSRSLTWRHGAPPGTRGRGRRSWFCGTRSAGLAAVRGVVRGPFPGLSSAQDELAGDLVRELRRLPEGTPEAQGEFAGIAWSDPSANGEGPDLFGVVRTADGRMCLRCGPWFEGVTVEVTGFGDGFVLQQTQSAKNGDFLGVAGPADLSLVVRAKRNGRVVAGVAFLQEPLRPRHAGIAAWPVAVSEATRGLVRLP